MIFNVGAGGASNAQSVKYDNSLSGLEADNVQGAVDEVTDSLNSLIKVGTISGTTTTNGNIVTDLTPQQIKMLSAYCTTNSATTIGVSTSGTYLFHITDFTGKGFAEKDLEVVYLYVEC